ncbi:hypothetical protein [Maridesulfovibrio sp.]|nr:hypothetical protein [Maridesulfovibrio sp.]
MTQTANISSKNKTKFLKKAFKSFSGQAGKKSKGLETQLLPGAEKDIKRS